MKDILSASILSANFSCLRQEIKACEDAGIDWIHIDVMDGHFVPNLTMGPFLVAECRKITKLPLDCHLMIEKPENLVEAFSLSGATNITIHPENNPNVLRTLQLIRKLGTSPGIAINPGTPAAVIEPLLPFIDLILVMTVNPGFSGQSFIPEMLEKISEISVMVETVNPQIRIEVDGGITPETILEVKNKGASAFVSATSIFKHPQGIAAGVKSLRRILD